MSWDLIFWIVALLSNIALLAVLIYQIICLSDLEADYLNPYESSSNINSVVLLEYLLQGAFSVVFLLTGHWLMIFVTLPVACYHIKWYIKREHLVDVTEIFRALSTEKRQRLIKLGFYLICFFLVIFRVVLALYNSLVGEGETIDGVWLF